MNVTEAASQFSTTFLHTLHALYNMTYFDKASHLTHPAKTQKNLLIATVSIGCAEHFNWKAVNKLRTRIEGNVYAKAGIRAIFGNVRQ